MSKESKGLPPFILERFEIVRQIGKGAYGLVYQATDKKTNEKVALKRCVKVLTNTTDARRTLREIAILSELRRARHPNLVQMTHAMAVPKTKSDLYLAFEFFEGDMRSGIRSALFRTHESVMQVAVQVLAGMAFMEQCGLLHRDMKPENLLVDTASRRIVIADFGLARCVDSMEVVDKAQLEEQSEGTLPYMAPELLLELSQPTFASDVWAFGVILGELFASKIWVKARGRPGHLQKILEVIGPPSGEYMSKLESEFLPAHLELDRCIEAIEGKEPEPGSNQVWRQTFGMAESVDIQLMKQLLAMDPANRLSCQEILEHEAIKPFLHLASEGLAVNSSFGRQRILVPLDDTEKRDVDIIELRSAIHDCINKTYSGCQCTLL